jgi:glycerol-3-phosphate acyltransferase PlsY
VLGPAIALGGYLLGSISPGLILAKRQGVDLREGGSGNVGATNVGRVLGKRAGRQVLALDAAKGALPALVARAALGPDDPWTAIAGVSAVLGHCYPIWHGFRGGKGAATGAGVLLATVPVAGLAAAGTYLGLKKVTRRASVGSLGGALVGAGVTWAALGAASPRTWMALGIHGLVIVRHRENLARLARGEEPPS